MPFLICRLPVIPDLESLIHANDAVRTFQIDNFLRLHQIIWPMGQARSYRSPTCLQLRKYHCQDQRAGCSLNDLNRPIGKIKT